MGETRGVAVGSRRHRGTPSAGVPQSAADARMAELEDRLAKLESSEGIRDRGRRMMDRVVPPEASRHFRNAGRDVAVLVPIRAIAGVLHDHGVTAIGTPVLREVQDVIHRAADAHAPSRTGSRG